MIRSVMMFFLSLSAINPNVLVVAQDQKLHREQMKAAHEAKIDRERQEE